MKPSRQMTVPVVLCGLLLATTTFAQQPNVLGAGQVSCSAWSAERGVGYLTSDLGQRRMEHRSLNLDEAAALQQSAWVLGYLSAARTLGYAFDGDQDALLARVADYCLENEDDTIADAVGSLLNDTSSP